MAIKSQQEYTNELVKKYGQNSTSYLTLEDDKSLYFGEKVEGVVAYGIVGRTVVVCGDPICAQDDFIDLLTEFKLFCEKYSCQHVFIGTTDVFINQYKTLGYSHVPYGEEARFHLASYQLGGRAMRRMRDQVNHANKAGITTHEYRPKENRDLAIEEEMNSISEQWLQGKKSGQLGFVIGTVSLQNPMDRRYFYAKDAKGRIVAFHVFTPFAGMKGYTAAITRRIPEAPRGVTEKINYDAFMTFKDEGVEWGSIGRAPLANIRKKGEKQNVDALFLNFIYEKFNRFYGFKALHQTKRKYNPTMWIPGYLVYSTKIITPQMAYAIVKIQNPGGIKDYLCRLLSRVRLCSG